MSDKPAKMGRPTLYTEAIGRAICRHTAKTGCGLQTGANLEGIEESTARRWKKDHADFRRLWEKARATHRRMVAEQLTTKCNEGDTTGIIFSLKTTGEWNDRAGQEQKIELEIKGAKKLIVESDEDEQEGA